MVRLFDLAAFRSITGSWPVFRSFSVTAVQILVQLVGCSTAQLASSSLGLAAGHLSADLDCELLVCSLSLVPVHWTSIAAVRPISIIAEHSLV